MDLLVARFQTSPSLPTAQMDLCWAHWRLFVEAIDWTELINSSALQTIRQCLLWYFSYCDVISWSTFNWFISLKSLQPTLKGYYESKNNKERWKCWIMSIIKKTSKSVFQQILLITKTYRPKRIPSVKNMNNIINLNYVHILVSKIWIFSLQPTRMSHGRLQLQSSNWIFLIWRHFQLFVCWKKKTLLYMGSQKIFIPDRGNWNTYFKPNQMFF